MLVHLKNSPQYCIFLELSPLLRFDTLYSTVDNKKKTNQAALTAEPLAAETNFQIPKQHP